MGLGTKNYCAGEDQQQFGNWSIFSCTFMAWFLIVSYMENFLPYLAFKEFQKVQESDNK
jgi:hypothetical protein